MSETRDVRGAYKRAMVEEYASLVRAGRVDEAAHVAGVLREQFGHEVEQARRKAPGEPPEREHAASPPLPETAAPEKPGRTPGRRPGRRPADSED